MVYETLPETKAAPLGRAAGHRPVPRAYWLLLALFAALQLVDILSTNRALALVPNAVELNPLMALAQSHLGPVWWLPKLALIAFAVAVAPRTRRHWPVALAVSLYGLVVLSNLACL